MNYVHIPVLLEEVIARLQPKPGGTFIDATLGGGGYTQAVFERVQPGGKILAIDLDADAIENQRLRVKDQNIFLEQGNFKNIDAIAEKYGFMEVDGIVADIGLSSYQLDQSERGISFQKNEPLDMRFDRSVGKTAQQVLNTYTEKELYRIFAEYGEEKFSRQIVKKILEYKVEGRELKSTQQLYLLIVDALPKPVKHKANDTARRVFQALRIEVNGELENLKEFLPKAFQLLKKGGRLAVVSFHSLEDRKVKEYFLSQAKGCVCPIDFPKCVCGKEPKGKILTKKPVTASEKEVKENPRSISAKMRVIEKI